MKSLISEIVKIQLVRELLSEGRIDDVKAKFPQDIEVIDYFSSQDPSGNNKYLPWEMKMYKQLPAKAPVELKERHKELIANLIKGFHQHAQRLQMRDINQYKTLVDLNTVISPLIKASEEKVAMKLKQEEGSHKLYEDKNWLLIIPLTHEASCKYGANTKWCVASRDTSGHFKNYTKEGLLVYLIDKTSNNKFAFYHEYPIGGRVEIYNPVDNDISDYYNINGNVKTFLQGLVNGRLEEYLQDDDGDYEYEVIWTNRNGYERRANIYDDNDLVSLIFDIVIKHFLGAGSSRNTFQKYVDVYAKFGVNLKLQGKNQSSPFILSDDNGTILNSSNWIVGGDVSISEEKYFNVQARRGFFNNWLENYLLDNYEDDINHVLDIARNNGMNIRIIGPGYEEKAETKSKTIMSKEEASSIYKSYSDYIAIAENERKKRAEQLLNELLEGVTVDVQKFEPCYDSNRLLNILGSVPNLKAKVIRNLRNRDRLKGRLPRNWPSTPEQKQLFLSEYNRGYISTCLREMNNNTHISTLPVINTEKNNRKREYDLGWLYHKLSDGGALHGRIHPTRDYENLIKLLIDRGKTKNEKNG